MKKLKFKITRGLKTAMLVSSMLLTGVAIKAQSNNALAFVPIALVAGLKKKNFQMTEEEENLMFGMEAELNDALKAQFDGLMTAEEFKTKMDALKLQATSIMIGEGDKAKSVDAILRDWGTDITNLKNGGAVVTRTTKQLQFDAVQNLVKEVKAHKSQSQGTSQQFFVSVDKTFDDTNKAAQPMTSQNVNDNAAGVEVPVGYVYGVEANPEPDVRIDPYITQFLDNGNTNLSALPYMDKTPTEGTMAITAEGALKPLLSWANERRFSTAFKIAGRAKVTEEALDDIPGLVAQANNELRHSHDIAEQDAVYAHVAAFAPSFVAGDLASSTSDPSNWDAVRATIYAVKIASKGRYMPNAVVINSADAYAMGATKDTTGQYVIPTFVLPDGTKISGVRVVETQDDDNVPAGSFIVGDWRKVKRRVYKPFNLRLGQGINGNAVAANITSDFETNQYTFIGESRLHLWHYKNNETAFIKADFDTVKEAISNEI